MPTYEYVCEKDSEHKYKETRGMNDEPTRSTCAEEGCDGNLKRVFGTPPIIFKGTGFSSSRG